MHITFYETNNNFLILHSAYRTNTVKIATQAGFISFICVVKIALPKTTLLSLPSSSFYTNYNHPDDALKKGFFLIVLIFFYLCFTFKYVLMSVFMPMFPTRFAFFYMLLLIYCEFLLINNYSILEYRSIKTTDNRILNTLYVPNSTFCPK